MYPPRTIGTLSMIYDGWCLTDIPDTHRPHPREAQPTLKVVHGVRAAQISWCLPEIPDKRTPLERERTALILVARLRAEEARLDLVAGELLVQANAAKERDHRVRLGAHAVRGAERWRTCVWRGNGRVRLEEDTVGFDMDENAYKK